MTPSHFLAVLDSTSPKTVTVNEFTTVKLVWTAAQFLEGDVLSGQPLGLRIAAGNVPNFVDLAELAATGKVDVDLRGKKPFALMRLPGHHATPTVAMGFVLLNSIAIATAANVTGSGTSTVTEEIQTQQQDSEIWIMKSL